MLKAKTSEQDKAEYAAAKSPENLGKNRNESIVPCKLQIKFDISKVLHFKIWFIAIFVSA